MNDLEVRYPEVEVVLIGEDGNAYAILGRVLRALRRAGVSKEERDAFVKEATSGDYDQRARSRSSRARSSRDSSDGFARLRRAARGGALPAPCADRYSGASSPRSTSPRRSSVSEGRARYSAASSSARRDAASAVCAASARSRGIASGSLLAINGFF